MAEEKNAVANEREEDIKIGTELVKQLSTSFYPKSHMIFDELVSNSRDAGATMVDIKIYDDFVEISDNGEGMSEDELVRYFYISSTHKANITERYVRGIKRKIIGKFGIGKLSMYQICRKFNIESWKDGIMSSSEFDFSKFEENKYIDDFKLIVKSEHTEREDSGTKITMYELRPEKKVKPLQIKRELMMNMPLTEDFKISIMWKDLQKPIILAQQDFPKGRRYDVKENVNGLGEVTGKIVYKDDERGDYGVYVRVLGRLVKPPTQEKTLRNVGEDKEIREGGSFYINFAALSHARQFIRRIYAELNIDSLNDALQTNRVGFVSDHPKYIIFLDWLKRALNKYNEKEYSQWLEVKDSLATESIPEMITSELKDIENLAMKESKEDASKEKSQPGYLSSDKKHHGINEREKILNTHLDVKVRSKPLGQDGPEAVVENDKKLVIVNTSHPVYAAVKARGGLWGVKYHALKSTVVALSIERSASLEEFKQIYEEMSKNTSGLLMTKLKRQKP